MFFVLTGIHGATWFMGREREREREREKREISIFLLYFSEGAKPQ